MKYVFTIQTIDCRAINRPGRTSSTYSCIREKDQEPDVFQSRLVHVFIAAFETRENAFAFGHPHWEPEPAGDVSDEEYAAWEDRNPRWPMKAELRCRYLDGDFIEVIWKDADSELEASWPYLLSLLARADIDAIAKIMPSLMNTLLVVDDEALGGFDVELRSTDSMIYCGSYQPLRQVCRDGIVNLMATRTDRDTG